MGMVTVRKSWHELELNSGPLAITFATTFLTVPRRQSVTEWSCIITKSKHKQSSNWLGSGCCPASGQQHKQTNNGRRSTFVQSSVPSGPEGSSLFPQEHINYLRFHLSYLERGPETLRFEPGSLLISFALQHQCYANVNEKHIRLNFNRMQIGPARVDSRVTKSPHWSKMAPPPEPRRSEELRRISWLLETDSWMKCKCKFSRFVSVQHTRKPLQLGAKGLPARLRKRNNPILHCEMNFRIIYSTLEHSFRI